MLFGVAGWPEMLDLARAADQNPLFDSVWVGDSVTTDITCDLILAEQEAEEEGVERIKRLLQDKGVLFRPW